MDVWLKQGVFMCHSSSLMQCMQRNEACWQHVIVWSSAVSCHLRLPFSPLLCTMRVTQLSEVLELLIERLVLEVSVLNEVSSQWDFHSSSFARCMSSAATLPFILCRCLLFTLLYERRPCLHLLLRS